MVIYKHNLAEKLFGFAYSKEFLRQNTALCPFVDDPNLSLDIDLAVEFHKALRSDPIAAEKVTNLLILSSAYIDVSTAEFYTDKMKTYPVFDDHITRINDLFVNIPNLPKEDLSSLPEDERERKEIGKYILEQISTFPKVSGIPPTTPDGIPYPTPEQILYERVSLVTGYTPQQLSDITFNSNFNNAFKNALEDCLNSPCNLFSETSDSIASLANQASMMNSTTMPTWGELKNNFFNAIGGVPDTIFKKVPMSIKNSIIELGQLGQQAIEQSTEMFFAKDPDKKKKIIQKALAGQSLNTDSTGYKYLPDLDSYLNVTKMSSNILKKAADDLGGCFNKFQQAARYEPYNPEHNKSITSKDPISNKRGDDSISTNTTGQLNHNYDRNTGSMSSCSPPQVAPPGRTKGSTRKLPGGYDDQYQRVLKSLKGSRFDPSANGGKKIKPEDGEKYGIYEGTLEEWATFFTRLAVVESTLRPGIAATIEGKQVSPDDPRATSFGLYQMGLPQFNTYGGSGKDWTDPDVATDVFINYAEALYFGDNQYGVRGGVGRIATSSKGGISAGYGPLQRTNNGTQNENESLLLERYSGSSSSGSSSASSKTLWYGDSIAVGYGKDADGKRKVGASPKTILGYIESALNVSSTYFEGKTVYLSTGISNNKSDLTSVESQIATLTNAGATVRVLGAANGTYDSQNAKISEITGKYNGATYLGGFTPGSDGVHPKNYNSLPGQ